MQIVVKYLATQRDTVHFLRRSVLFQKDKHNQLYSAAKAVNIKVNFEFPLLMCS